VNIGIICYASVGGSGIIATELGKMLASRGHSVHILSSDTPFRFGDYEPGLQFHRVDTPDYPLFREPQYILSLANKIVQVARHERLDIVHAHYAIPHATAAYLARQILASTGDDTVPRTITTLHRRVLHRPVGRGDRRVREPQGGHASRALREERHSRHPEFSQLGSASTR
jgi:glycosyltransferase involved in cell wall biosynthesis